VKTNKDRHILSTAQISGMDLVSADITFMLIFGQVLYIKETLKDSVVAR